jgi:hypothetical protein
MDAITRRNAVLSLVANLPALGIAAKLNRLRRPDIRPECAKRERERYVRRAMAAVLERTASRIPPGATLGGMTARDISERANHYRRLADALT